MKTSFDFTDERTLCLIEDDKNNTFFGYADCAPDDMDFHSEKTGAFIAESRATQHYLKHLIKNDLRPQLKALDHLLSTISETKKDQYTYNRILAERDNVQAQLIATQETLKDVQVYLKGYINQKDKLYKRIRAQKADNSN